MKRLKKSKIKCETVNNNVTRKLLVEETYDVVESIVTAFILLEGKKYKFNHQYNKHTKIHIIDVDACDSIGDDLLSIKLSEKYKKNKVEITLFRLALDEKLSDKVINDMEFKCTKSEYRYLFELEGEEQLKSFFNQFNKIV